MKKNNLFLLAMVLTPKAPSNLLGEGDHAVMITEASETEAEISEHWKDRTPQLKVVFKELNGTRTITAWYNARGFKKFEDLTAAEKSSGKFEPRGVHGYAVNKKTNVRVIDDTKTQTAIDIMNKLAGACGFELGQEISTDDLINCEVAIHVKTNELGNLRVAYAQPVDSITA